MRRISYPPENKKKDKEGNNSKDNDSTKSKDRSKSKSSKSKGSDDGDNQIANLKLDQYMWIPPKDKQPKLNIIEERLDDANESEMTSFNEGFQKSPLSDQTISIL